MMSIAPIQTNAVSPRSAARILFRKSPAEYLGPFAPPHHCSIQIPEPFASDWQRSRMFRLGCHEIGHALANLLFCERVDAVMLTEIDGGGRGCSYGQGKAGNPDSCRVNLAGIAAERLIEGEPLPIIGFDRDIKNARDDLIAMRHQAGDIDAELSRVYSEVQATFSLNWTAAITDAAKQLVRRGILDGAALFEIFSEAQANAADFGDMTFSKAMKNPSITNMVSGPYHEDVTLFKRKRFSIKISK